MSNKKTNRKNKKNNHRKVKTSLKIKTKNQILL